MILEFHGAQFALLVVRNLMQLAAGDRAAKTLVDAVAAVIALDDRAAAIGPLDARAALLRKVSVGSQRASMSAPLAAPASRSAGAFARCAAIASLKSPIMPMFTRMTEFLQPLPHRWRSTR